MAALKIGIFPVNPIVGGIPPKLKTPTRSASAKGASGGEALQLDDGKVAAVGSHLYDHQKQVKVMARYPKA